MNMESPAAVQPRKSAAAIILSENPTPQVLLVRRNDRLRFMGGHHAFPGGRIEEAETAERVVGVDDLEEARAIHALAREIFEETGLLCVSGSLPPMEELRRARRELLSDQLDFDRILDRFDLRIPAGEFIPAGIWITPKGSPIRFHSRYYLYRHRGARYEELIRGEIDGLDWMNPALARKHWREGSILLPPPVAYVLQQIDACGFPACLEPLRRTTHVVPDTPGRIEYRCGIHVLPLRAPALPPADHTNCVVIGERELYVIDPGTPWEEEQRGLKRQLDHLLELGGRVGAVILTHSHPDHVGAAEFVRHHYGAPIWAHEAAADQLEFPVDRFLSDNEIIRVSGEPEWRLRCLHTPGHDPGHLCLLEETTRTLLCGDMVAEKGTIIISTEHGGDMTSYLESLERLLGEPFDMMLPAHGLAIGSPKDKIRQYIEHRLDRERRIQAAWEAGIREMSGLLAAAYDDVSREVWPLAEKSLKAHLVRLGVNGP